MLEGPIIQQTSPTPSVEKSEPEAADLRPKEKVLDQATREKIEALKEQAEALIAKAKQNLTENFGSIEAAQSFYKPNEFNNIDPYSQNPEAVRRLNTIHFAGWNLRAMEDAARIQSKLQEGSDAPYFDNFKTFENNLIDLAARIDRSNFVSIAKPENPEPKMEQLKARADSLLVSAEAKFNQIKDKSTWSMTPEEGSIYYSYLDLGNIKRGLEKKTVGTYQMDESGNLWLSYMPRYQWINVEERLGEIERALSR